MQTRFSYIRCTCVSVLLVECECYATDIVCPGCPTKQICSLRIGSLSGAEPELKLDMSRQCSCPTHCTGECISIPYAAQSNVTRMKIHCAEEVDDAFYIRISTEKLGILDSENDNASINFNQRIKPKKISESIITNTSSQSACNADYMFECIMRFRPYVQCRHRLLTHPQPSIITSHHICHRITTKIAVYASALCGSLLCTLYATLVHIHDMQYVSSPPTRTHTHTIKLPS